MPPELCLEDIRGESRAQEGGRIVLDQVFRGGGVGLADSMRTFGTLKVHKEVLA